MMGKLLVWVMEPSLLPRQQTQRHVTESLQRPERIAFLFVEFYLRGSAPEFVGDLIVDHDQQRIEPPTGRIGPAPEVKEGSPDVSDPLSREWRL